MLCTELFIEGGTKNGLDMEILLNVPPLENPVRNAELAPDASLRTSPEIPGANAPGPTKNWLYRGELLRKLSATVAGKKSWKNPIPPRTTVLVPDPRGVHANPRRGSQAMFV